MKRFLLALSAVVALSVGAGAAQAHDPFCHTPPVHHHHRHNSGYGHGGGYGGYSAYRPVYVAPQSYRPYGYGYSGGYVPYQAGGNRLSFSFGW